MARKLHSIVFAVFIVFVSYGVQAALAQRAGQDGARRVAASRDNQAQLQTRILGIKDEVSLDATLVKLFGEGKLTKEQATKIKTQWQKRQGQNRPFPAIDRLRAIQDEGKLKEALQNLVTDGKITPDQAARIHQQWQDKRGQAGASQAQGQTPRIAKAKGNARPRQILNRVRGARTEAQVDKILDNMVSKGRITKVQADKIKVQWGKRR